MRKISLLLCGAAFGAAAVLGATQAVHFVPARAFAASAETYRQLNLFGDVFESIRQDYVEQPDESKLIEAAINGMLSSLDPHSAYLSPKSQKDMNTEMRGEFGGLGIEVMMEKELLKVVKPIEDTPASKAGLQANDTIVKLDGTEVKGMNLKQAVDKMRGPVNSSIVLTIQREGKDDPFDVKLTRDIIKVKSVKWRSENDVAYIQITQFTEQTGDGLREAIEKATKTIGPDTLKGYVLDLRNNPGGLLDQAVEVADDFLERGEIVSTRGKNPEETQRRNARPGDLTNGKPVIVLINGGSASASEIVAGALQDQRRATVVGTRSFGKGSVQTIKSLGANGALKLTTARYYTPSGRSIQAKGIEPDIEVLQDVPPELQGKDDLKGEASLKGHLQNGEATDEKTGSQAYVPPKVEDDKALNLAFDLLRGIKVNQAFPPNPKVATPN
jgi:carboxyl-terminal processing protease